MIKPNGSRVKDRIDSTYLARPFWMTPNTLVFVYVPAQRGDRATVARARVSLKRTHSVNLMALATSQADWKFTAHRFAH